MRNNIQLQTVYWLIAAFAVSFFALVFPYYKIPYAKLSLSSTLLWKRGQVLQSNIPRRVAGHSLSSAMMRLRQAAWQQLGQIR